MEEKRESERRKERGREEEEGVSWFDFKMDLWA